MTRRRKTLLVVLALVLLAGGFAWHWQATAVDREVDALLAEVRKQEPGLIEGWLIRRGLRHDRRTGRALDEVAAELAKLGPSAVPELVWALRDSDQSVRCVAAWALGDLGDARGVEPLIAGLKDENLEARRAGAHVLTEGMQGVRWHAVEARGKLGDRRAVEPLIEVLKDGSGLVRLNAVEALGELGDPRAVEPLKALLGEKDADVRKAATEALQQLRGHSEAKP